MVKVSVIIPVYNASEYLEQCLDSILAQTLKEIEIICVDDGSKDDSPDILRKYQKKDDRVRVIEQKNAGAGAARNNGLKNANGKYLSFLDADDFFEPEMLEKAFLVAEEDQSDLVVFQSDQYYNDTDEFVFQNWVVRKEHIPPYHPFHYRQLTTNIFKAFVGWAWDKLFLRSFVEKHQLRFQEQRTSNDLLFVFSSVFLADRISICEEVLAHQRRDAKDSLSKTREGSWHCFFDALTALKKRLIEEGKYRELEKDYINYALHFSMWNYNTLSEPAKGILGNKLSREWFRELGIQEKSEEYFTNINEYSQYLDLMKEYAIPEEGI